MEEGPLTYMRRRGQKNVGIHDTRQECDVCRERERERILPAHVVGKLGHSTGLWDLIQLIPYLFYERVRPEEAKEVEILVLF